MKKKEPAKISVEEFDRRFDDGEDISEFIDWESARLIIPESQRLNEQAEGPKGRLESSSLPIQSG